MKSLALVLCLLPCMVTAQTDKWQALPNETTWAWLVRVGLCTTGGCQGGNGAMAFVDWSDAVPSRYVDLELAPDEPLLSSHPFQEPAPGQQFYDERCEEQVQWHESDGGWIVSRMYWRGLFVGYLLWRPPVSMMVI